MESFVIHRVGLMSYSFDLCYICTMKSPQLMSLEELYNRYVAKSTDESNRIYFNRGLGAAMDLGNAFKGAVSTGTPFLIPDYRFGVVKRGLLRTSINLMMHDIGAESILFIIPGTIVEPKYVSDDFMLDGMSIPSDVFQLAHQGHVPSLFTGHVKDGVTVPTHCDFKNIDDMLNLFFSVIKSRRFGQNVGYGLITAITNAYCDVFVGQQVVNGVNNVAKNTFHRFISLVNQNCTRHRQIKFYAQKLCLTERYLGTLIRQVSGITAKEWIDRATITAAKVMLRHSDVPITTLAEKLNFANPSFFCKYFKRLTGITPQAYRNIQ